MLLSLIGHATNIGVKSIGFKSTYL